MKARSVGSVNAIIGDRGGSIGFAGFGSTAKPKSEVARIRPNECLIADISCRREALTPEP